MGSPAEDLVAALRAADATVATAESLTGGLVATRITAVPGSSAVFAGGVISYQTRVKVEVLGVPQHVIDDHGVISAECAIAMACGARRLVDTTYAVSTTGVAGPERQEGQPVGTVFVGVAGPDGAQAHALSLDGNRGEVQNASVAAALSALAGMISADRTPPEDSVLR